ncbi:MAG: peptidase M48 [Azospira oryzae]|uniref:M48 family metalloprotease n=1 Tax=Pelomicrobium methylotrophicum TaxID=2602750 RepID=A0A5C7EJ07_9PROT|nr:zinc metalloprotease HtpX [Pelomicrobium methylotrophicum]PZP55472.1 MAG: peptidase M48 [Azospira oryzae]PZP77949.1 MAG: peptidase M48 [Azospira oryzae]TXF11365.1 M48 family metalloprotease [Pelomicrobium methylotrophicum]
MNRSEALKHRLYNAWQSAALLGAMAGIAGLAGWLIAGTEGLIWWAVLVPIVLAIGPKLSPHLILRAYKAREIPPWYAPDLYRLVEALARRAQLPAVPRLYYVPSRALNAFTVGDRASAAIAVTDGLLRAMGPRELMGVLAHEIAHVRNNDIWVMQLADVVSRVTAFLSLAGLVLLMVTLPAAYLAGYEAPWSALLVLAAAPHLTTLLQLGLSRVREYDADRAAAELTGDPLGLASALEKLERRHRPWIEQIFFPGRHTPEPAVLRTHPPTRERIRRLLAMAQTAPEPWRGPWDLPFLRQVPPVTRRPRWHVHGLWY